MVVFSVVAAAAAAVFVEDFLVPGIVGIAGIFGIFMSLVALFRNEIS